MKNKFVLWGVLTIGIAFFSNNALASTKQIIAGAGPSTKIVQKFFESFILLPEAQGTEFEVPLKSSKHKGGITCSDFNLFGRTGRPLNEDEKALNKDEIFLARVPVVLIAGKGTGIIKLTLSQLEYIISGKITNWKDVGGTDNQIILIGREATEAIFSELKKDYPFFEKANFKITFEKDNHVIDYFKNNSESRNALGFGALPDYIDVEEVDIVLIDGFESGVSIGLVYDLKNKDNEIVKAAKNYAGSAEWKQIVADTGLLPVN